MSKTFQLAQQDGVERRSVDITVTPGQVRISATDSGPTARHVWGSDGEYEFWVDVTDEAIAALLLALLKEKYAGNLRAVDQFRSFCKDNSVPHHFMTWS